MSGTMLLLDYMAAQLDQAYSQRDQLLADYHRCALILRAATTRLFELDDFDGLLRVAAVAQEHQEDA